ncbi:hypothetical protein HMPREF1550_02715, partial [Actinomyces sp. oral taxon 877 str. F0543]
MLIARSRRGGTRPPARRAPGRPARAAVVDALTKQREPGEHPAAQPA